MGSKLALAAFALFMTAVLAMSGRPWSLTSAPRVREIAVLPDTPELAAVRRYTEIGSGRWPRLAGDPTIAESDRRVRLGWSYREIGILRMPLFASREAGFVTYVDVPGGTQFALLSAEQVALIDRVLGTEHANTYRFPWWEYLWGWIAAVLLALWLFLYRREAARREDARWAVASDGS
jgi:hypothetical protein